MSVTLHVGSSRQQFQNSHKDLKKEANFDRAVVATGTWIFYTYADYNDVQHGGSKSNYLILEPGADKNISAVNGSMYLLPDAVEGVVLFEHAYYGGERMWYDDSSPDLSDIFPAGTTEGVSAATVLAQHQTFAAFNKINYQGLETQLKPGQWYESPEEMGFGNDTMLSIRRN